MIHPTLVKNSLNNRLHKYAILFFCIILLPIAIWAQAKTQNTPLTDTNKVTDIRERLVQLALQNPSYEMADRQVLIANYQLRKAKNSILGKLNLNSNVNEYTLKIKNVPGDNNNLFFPLFNVGIALPLDLFSSRRNEVGIAKQNIGIAQATRNERFREIKADVLIKYEDYLMLKQKLEYASQISADAEAIFLQAEKDFSDGIIKQEDYNKAYKERTEEKTKLAEIVRSFNVIKIEIEKLIGIPLDEVLQQIDK